MQEQTDIALLVIIGSLAMVFFVGVIILFVMKYQQRMKQNALILKKNEEEKQKELFQASVATEERERERIARNLHDEINPLLTVLRQNLSQQKINALKNKPSLDIFEANTDLIDRAIEGIRNSTYDLIPSFMLQFGIIKSLADYLSMLNDSGKAVTSLTNSGNFDFELYFSKSEQLNIYRICLEIINNILKHARCTALSLEIVAEHTTVTLIFEHNGIGVTNAEIDQLSERSSGLGLKSIKARAFILSGIISYEKWEDKARVQLNLPLKK